MKKLPVCSLQRKKEGSSSSFCWWINSYVKNMMQTICSRINFKMFALKRLPDKWKSLDGSYLKSPPNSSDMEHSTTYSITFKQNSIPKVNPLMPWKKEVICFVLHQINSKRTPRSKSMFKTINKKKLSWEFWFLLITFCWQALIQK